MSLLRKEKRAQEKAEKKAQEKETKIDRSKWQAIKQAVREIDDKVTQQQANMARMKFMDRWADMSGLKKDSQGKYDYSQIDYEDKFILLEWYMCDPYILFNLGNPKYREKTLKSLPDKCQEAYYEVGPGNSKPYSEVYTGVTQLKNAFGMVRKEQAGKKE